MAITTPFDLLFLFLVVVARQQTAHRFGLLDMAITTPFELLFLFLVVVARQQSARRFGFLDTAITTRLESNCVLFRLGMQRHTYG